MLKSAVRASVVAGVLGLSSLAFAQSDTSSGQAPKSGEKRTYEKESAVPKQNLRTFTLTVKDVDKTQHRVGFEAQISPEANIMQSGQPIKLDQLNEGDQVRASFDPATGDIVKLEVIPSSRSGSGGSGQPPDEEKDEKKEK